VANPLSGIELPAQLTFSYGVGRAAGGVLEPQLQGLKNSSWALVTGEGVSVPPSPSLLAAGVAQGQIDPKLAATWATYSGVDQPTFDALVAIANVGPGTAYAFELWRRGIIGESGFRRAVKRLGWEQEWIDDAVSLKTIRLSPEALAVMIQRSVVPNPGILPNQPPTDNSDVPPMPVVDLDVFAEAAAHGVDEDRLKAMARIIGLPASPDLAARMHFRGIINEDAFNQAIKEGNTRGEWAPFLLQGFREIPTAEQFVEAHLRGWITRSAMYAGTARHGMSEPDTDLEFQIHRRPLTPHQIKQALARGASFNPEAGEITNPYSASVHQANLGPEWYEMAEALAGSYPSVFVTNRLVTGGTITPAEGSDWLARSGLADRVVTALHDSWTGGTGVKADPHVTKAQNHLWTTAQTSYIAGETDAAAVTAALPHAGVDAATIPDVLAIWDATRTLVRKQLSPTQVKKAYKEAVLNEETGSPWTRDEALAELIARGYAPDRADTFLRL
jgi:hypothetical protein